MLGVPAMSIKELAGHASLEAAMRNMRLSPPSERAGAGGSRRAHRGRVTVVVTKRRQRHESQ